VSSCCDCKEFAAGVGDSDEPERPVLLLKGNEACEPPSMTMLDFLGAVREAKSQMHQLVNEPKPQKKQRKRPDSRTRRRAKHDAILNSLRVNHSKSNIPSNIPNHCNSIPIPLTTIPSCDVDEDSEEADAHSWVHV